LEDEMLSKLAAAAAVLALTCASATAEDAKPNDAQIAHIAYTADQIDINAAELALQKSKNKEVRDFAENMLRDHKANGVHHAHPCGGDDPHHD
jgi:putative membrane protein